MPDEPELPLDTDFQPDPAAREWGRARAPEDEVLLHGPQKRGSELLRALRIFGEIIRGFRALHFVGPCVTIFGSARFPQTHPHCLLAREFGRAFGTAGFTIMTGGGPGIMEAANRGARDARARSIGCNIKLPKEQQPNPFLDQWVDFRYFFVRKLMLVKYSYAFIAAPGGYGTLDEIFECATLIQTGKIRDFPLVLAGKEYWQPMLEFIRGTMLRQGAIDAADVDRILVTDSAEEAVSHVKDAAMSRFGLTTGPSIKRRWWLGE
ncbi:MAG: TIGR00730 family Rossman fold protein [Planctomycetes bacterium]|nr:TIGR00730 family Rossman fold protein [Planctomycetota bacterium]